MSAQTNSVDALGRRLCELLAEVLGRAGDELDPAASFFSHGLDSLRGVALVRSINEELGLELLPTVLWEHSSVEALAEHLAGGAPSAAPFARPNSRGSGVSALAGPIAIVGFACRLPGADGNEALWRLLSRGIDAISEPPPGRWPGARGRWRGGFIDGIDRFDAEFFAISRREAVDLDPQQRLMLELTWHALEHAGIVPSSLRDSHTGVFCGAIWSDYEHLVARAEERSPYAVTGNHRSLLANRISYQFGLRGPSMSVDAACSSGLVAVHLASESLRRGESDLALASAVNLNILAESTLGVDRFGGLSPDGRCFTFDARANGYVRGEGGVVVVLKRLRDAVADGDRISAVIAGSAVNNDGASNGLTAPSPKAQEQVLREALARAEVAPADVHYVEAHGTGTSLGDPIEAMALSRVYNHGRSQPLRIGSAKTNMGHLEGAAGLVGLLKATLCLERGALVPSLNFEAGNPAIPFAEWGLEVQSVGGPWPAAQPRIAGVSAFGLGGTNSHVLLREWRPQVAFVMPGQGAHWPGMGRELLRESPAFREVILACDRWLREHQRWSLVELLRGPGEELERIERSLPAIIAMNVALAAHWRAAGVEPDAVLGHSTGEIAAACVAGALSLEDTMRVICAYGETIARQRGRGAMGVVGVPWGEAESLLGEHQGRVFRAIDDSAKTTVLAGEPAALNEVLEGAARRGLFARRVSIDVSPHCPLVADLLPELRARMSGIVPRPARVPLYSEVTGALIAGEALDVDHWVDNFGEQARFSGAVDAALEAGASILLEVGPHALLQRSLEANLERHGAPGRVLPSMTRGADGPRELSESLAVLTQLGVTRRSGSAENAGASVAESFETTTAARESPRVSAKEETLALPISARSGAGLRAQAERWGAALADDGFTPWASFVATATRAREAMSHRAVIVAGSKSEAASSLEALARGVDAAELRERGVVLGQARKVDPAARTVFFIPGQGSQWPGMGRALLERSPAFRGAIDALEPALSPYTGWSLRAVLSGEAGAPALDSAAVIQPALFGMALGLAAIWRSWGVVPDLVIGHSQGEIAAAVIAGSLSLEEGARLIAERSSLLAERAGVGAMAAIALPVEAVEARIAELPGLSIAVVNSASGVAIAGDPAAIDSLVAALTEEGVFCRRVAVDYASHSQHMDPLLPELGARIGGLAPRAGSILMISTVTGQEIDGRELGASYWQRNLRDPVRLDRAVERAIELGARCLVELSPHPALTVPLRAALEPLGGLVVGGLRRSEGGLAPLLRSLGALHCHGVDVEWSRVGGPAPLSRDAPGYAFQRERYWVDAPALGDPSALGQEPTKHPLTPSSVALPSGGVLLTGRISLGRQPWLGQHRVAGRAVVPGSALLEVSLLAADHVGAEGVVELVILAPLILGEGEDAVDVDLRVSAEPDGDDDCDGWTLQISSRAGLAEADGPWILHAEGRLGGSSGAAPVELRQWPPPGADPLAEPGDFYEAIAARGYGYGPLFRGIRAAWRDGEVLYATVARPELRESAAEFGLHPALFDAALHAVLLAGGDSLALPVAWGDVALYATGADELRVRLVPAGGGFAIDIADGSGAPVARVGSLMLRSVREDMLMDPAAAAGPTNYRLAWEEAPPTPSPPPIEGWAITAGALRTALEPLADPLEAAARASVPGGVVVDLTGDDGESQDIEAGCGATLAAVELLQRWLAEPKLAATRLVFVTRGALAAEAGEPLRDLLRAPLWGLVASSRTEHPGRGLSIVDVDRLDLPIELLRRALAVDEGRVLVRGDRVLVPRLVRGPSGQTMFLPATSWRLEPDGRGELDSVVAVPRTPPALRPGEVRVAVRAAGINFRDVLYALGLPAGDRPLGSDLAGVVVEVGAGPASFAVGDRVMGLGAGTFAEQVEVDARQLVPLPRGWDFSAGAGVATVFLTAWYGLTELVDLQPGAKILIHAATGGVGMAAVQIAKLRGAEVFATASPAKWPQLRAMGVDDEHIASSRDLSFAVKFRDLAGSIDVVFNSLIDEFVDASLGLQGQGGTFLELGKRDIRTGEAVAALAPGVRYRPFDLLEAGPARIGEMLREVAGLFIGEELQPSPVRCWDVRQLQAALRFMAQARHVGKLVLTMPRRLEPGGSALITGGTGAIGRAVGRHLISRHGLRHLILISRRGPEAPGVGEYVEELRGLGASVDVRVGDVSERAPLEEALASLPAESPLTAIVHCAGVLEDRTLVNLGPGEVRRVMAPKVSAALHLDELTRGEDLAAFVLCSSAAVPLGTPGQAHYAAANALLDGLASRRHAAGSPALSLAWGAWGEGGMMSGLREADRARLDRLGIGSLRAAEGLALFDAALEQAEPWLAPMRLDIDAWSRSSVDVPPVLAGLAKAQAQAKLKVSGVMKSRRRTRTVGSKGRPRAKGRAHAADFAASLRGLDEGARQTAALGLVATATASVLGRSSADALTPATKFTEVGVDSLMAVELRNNLQAKTGATLAVTVVFENPTLAELAAVVLEKTLAMVVRETVAPGAASLSREAGGESSGESGGELAGQFGAEVQGSGESVGSGTVAATSTDALRSTIEALLRAPDASLLATGQLARLRDRLARTTDVQPLSPGQAQLWFLQQVLDQPATYHVHLAWGFELEVDAALLDRALAITCGRHPQLRTRFVEGEQGLAQESAAELSPTLILRSLESRPQAEREEALSELTDELERTPFDLRVDPPLRVALVRLSPRENLLHVVWHHIVVDGWSIRVLMRDLSDTYQALAEGQAPLEGERARPYVEFASRQQAWLASQGAQREREYWRERLSGVERIALPVDLPLPARRSHAGATLSFSLSPALSRAIDELARSSECTAFIVLLGAWSMTLRGPSVGASSFVVGTVLAGRDDPTFDETVGYFIRTVPLRCDLDDDEGLPAYLGRLRAALLGAMRHQELPYGEIARCGPFGAARSVDEDPLLQSTFMLQDHALSEWSFAGAPMRRLPGPVSGDVEGTTKFDLSLSMTPSPEGYQATIEHATDLFSAPMIGLVRDRLRTILGRMVERPEARLGELIATPEGELARVAEWSNAEVEAQLRETVPGRFLEQARQTPELPAIVVGEATLTYGELGRRVTDLARSLQRRGVGRGVRVGVHLGRGLELPVALLGILAAGGVFVPLDPEYPAQRLLFMAEDSGLRLVISDQADALPWPQGVAVEGVRALLSDGEEKPFDMPVLAAGDLAYVIYTSGSTGRPKGVMIEHGGLRSVLHEMRELVRPAPGERVLSITTISFDPFMLELFGPLMGGGTVDLLGTATARDVDALIAHILATQPTVLQATPVIWRMVIDRGLPRAPGFQAPRVLCGGEAMDLGLARKLAAWSPSVANIYGPTEITLWATRWIAPKVPTCVRIGRPFDGVACYVLDPEGRRCPVGVAGELFLGGDRVAPGYCGRPDLTRERFVADPFRLGVGVGAAGARMYRTGDRVRWGADGELEFIGRMDRQVKIRGHRIELGEIEGALAEHSGVGQCGVIVKTSPAGHQRLVAYFSEKPRADAEPLTRERVREHLGRMLHKNMLPEGLVKLDKMPLTPNGKVDRVALAAMPDERAELLLEAAPARQPREGQALTTLVRGAVAEVLALPAPHRIKADLPLRDLGLNSLAAVELRNRIEAQVELKLPITLAFDHPTVAAIVLELEARLSARSAETEAAAAVVAGGSTPWSADVIAKKLASLDIAALRRSGLLPALMGLPETGTEETGTEETGGAAEEIVEPTAEDASVDLDDLADDELLELAQQLLGEP